MAGGVSLLALAMAAPGEGIAQRGAFTRAPHSARNVSSAASRRLCAIPDWRPNWPRSRASSSFQFTPATTQADRNARSESRCGCARARALRNARGRSCRACAAAVETPSGTAITPSTYNLGVAVGWRQFAITGDSSSIVGGIAGGSRDSARDSAPNIARRRV